MLSRIPFCGATASMTVVILAASNATAHHSFARHFDASKKVNVSGTVKEYEARNPHCERERAGRIATNAAAGKIAAAQGRLRNVVACAVPEPKR